MIVKFFIILLCGEVILAGLFVIINLLLKNSPKLFSWKSVIKGVLERLVMFFALVQGFDNIIMFFAAIKLGTRLKQDEETPISNEYFLIGNLVSIGSVITYNFLFNLENWLPV